jgi:hypothetical protein
MLELKICTDTAKGRALYPKYRNVRRKIAHVAIQQLGWKCSSIAGRTTGERAFSRSGSDGLIPFFKPEWTVLVMVISPCVDFLAKWTSRSRCSVASEVGAVMAGLRVEVAAPAVGAVVLTGALRLLIWCSSTGCAGLVNRVIALQFAVLSVMGTAFPRGLPRC